MKIEAGKFYRTKDGRKVGPMRPFSSPSGEPLLAAPFQGETYEWYWQPNGVFNGRNSHDDRTIVSEWTDAPATPKPLDVRVGDGLYPGVIFHLRAKVAPDGMSYFPVEASGIETGFSKAVLYVEPSRIRVGDRVRRFPNSPTGRVLHISREDGAALVRYEGGGPTVLTVDKLSELQVAGDLT